MAAHCVSTRALATWLVRFTPALLLFSPLSVGCVDLKRPSVLEHPDGNVVGMSKGGHDANIATPGSGGSRAVSSRATAGTAGTGGADSSRGAHVSTPADGGGTSGTNVSSSGVGSSASTQQPPGSGGQAWDAGPGGSATGGSAGGTRAVGGTTSPVDAGSVASRDGGSEGGPQPSPDAAADRTDSRPGPDAPDVAPARDTSAPDAPCTLCGLRGALVHRYDFNGTGTRVTDSVGTAHGTVVDAQLSNYGTLVLTGGTAGPYVQLPDHILSTLTSATLEIWVTWTGGNNNQRILDFGSSEEVNGRTQAVTTVIISPNSAPESLTPRLRTSYSSQVSTSSTFVDATGTLATGAIKQIVAVLDGQNHTLWMYLDGAFQGQVGGLGNLSLINDTNNYLGKSQYSNDPGFAGTYHEFRIYNTPLAADEIQALFAAGPNASFNQ